MAEISASLVMKLRKMSGQGMMDCKKALQQTDGDLDEAIGILRKKGMETLEKRSDRETSEGIIVGKISENGREAILAALCCETDFVAKSSDFTAAAEALANYAMSCQADEGTENLMETSLNGKKFSDILTETVSKTGEKTQIGDFKKYKLDGPGLISIYIHFNKKVGAMVEIETSDKTLAQNELMKRIAADIAMHVTAIKPLALNRESLDAEIVNKEKEIVAEQFKNKPANVAEKIVEGKMKKFYAENCLLDQPFVKDDDKTVAEIVAQTAQKAGGKATVKRFVRFEVG